MLKKTPEQIRQVILKASGSRQHAATYAMEEMSKALEDNPEILAALEAYAEGVYGITIEDLNSKVRPYLGEFLWKLIKHVDEACKATRASRNLSSTAES